jgi:hypothetical protein
MKPDQPIGTRELELRTRSIREVVRVVCLIVPMILPLLGAGCSTTPSGQEQTSAVAGQDAVTVLLNYLGLEGRTMEQEMVDCVSDAIRRSHPNVRVVPPDEFRRVAFPDLTPDAAPRSPRYLGMLLDNTVFRESIAPLRLRYVIMIGGETRVEQKGGMTMLPASVPGGPFPVGGWVRNNETELVASILDLAQTRPSAELNASARGTSWMVLLGLLPVAASARTEASACAQLGDEVARFLTLRDQ